MIALLSYSTNSLANEGDSISSTGGQDSILIAYNDLRKVNSKLIELSYEKEINKELKAIIVNDSCAIDNLKRRIDNDARTYEKRVQQVKKQRNTAYGVTALSIVLLIISIL